MGGLVLLCFAVVGARAIFSLPFELRANWVFWLTAVQPPAAYFRAVRKALFSLTVLPVWMAAAAAYFLIWPARPAALHMLVLSLAAILFVHVSLYQFRKIPFACSYLPGKSNMHVRLALYGGTLILVASFCVQIEYFTMPYPWRFGVFCGFLSIAAAWAVRHWSNFANSPYNWIQFEELPQADVEALDLHNPPATPPSAPPPLETGVSIRPQSIYALQSAVESPPGAAAQ
jgi:hypothetical protein